jgi:hypothetical protein
LKRPIKKRTEDSQELKQAKGIADLLDIHAAELDKGFIEIENTIKKMAAMDMTERQRKEVHSAIKAMCWNTGKAIRTLKGDN